MNTSNHLITSQPGIGYFTPERLSVLKRVFDEVCREFNVAPGPAQDDLAHTIVQAGKTAADEKALKRIARKYLGGIVR